MKRDFYLSDGTYIEVEAHPDGRVSAALFPVTFDLKDLLKSLAEDPALRPLLVQAIRGAMPKH